MYLVLTKQQLMTDSHFVSYFWSKRSCFGFGFQFSSFLFHGERASRLMSCHVWFHLLPLCAFPPVFWATCVSLVNLPECLVHVFSVFQLSVGWRLFALVSCQYSCLCSSCHPTLSFAHFVFLFSSWIFFCLPPEFLLPAGVVFDAALCY